MSNITSREVIGLIPAAGKASRLAPIPCSKELYPVGFRALNDNDFRPKVISHYLLEKMRLADIKKAFIIIRDGKWDIPAYFGDGSMLDMHLAYLMMDLPYGAPYTLDQAFPFVRNSMIALGFPDMIFSPSDAFSRLLAQQQESMADIVLGIFPADKPHKTDMVEIDNSGRIRSIQIKPEKTELSYTWEIAVWTPLFTRFMHDYVLSSIENARDNEPFVGDVIQAAIKQDIHVDSVIFDDGMYLDIGTPDDLVRALKMNHDIS